MESREFTVFVDIINIDSMYITVEYALLYMYIGHVTDHTGYAR